jgi:eukaryotic-like serine/threonine-protein kinase
VTSDSDTDKTLVTGRRCLHCDQIYADTVSFCPTDGTPLSTGNGDEVLSLPEYEILGLIGQGGMGAIYKARHRIIERIVAIKVLLASRMTLDDVHRFQREGKAVSKLNHPNIISVLEFGIAKSGSPFMVMEYVDGFSLSDLLKKRAALSIAETMRISLQICAAMEHAHAAGILHRDLKPSNIMLANAADNKYKVKIVDFGIAKIAQMEKQRDATLTRTGDIFGSPNYMSPEQAQGLIPDRRTDIYSTGCIIYEMLTGAPPLVGINLVETLSKQINDVPLQLKEAALGKKFPNSLELLVAKTLAKEPEKRFQTFTELGEAISASSQGQIAKSSTPVTAVNILKSRLVLYVVTGILIVGLALVCLFNVSGKHTDSEPTTADPEITKLKNVMKENAPSSIKEGNDDAMALLNEKPVSSRPVMVSLIRSSIRNGEVIELSFTTITPDELEEISKYQSIQGVLLDGTRVGDTVFDYITHVKMPRLSLRNSWVTDKGLTHLGEMQTLTDLEIGHYYKPADHQSGQIMLSDETLKQISKLHNLTKLGLSDLGLNDASIAFLVPLKNLTALDLSSNWALTNAVFHYINQFPALSNLNLHGVMHVQIDALINAKFIGRLTALNLHAVPDLNDENLAQLLSKATKLETLDASETSITDKSLQVMEHRTTFLKLDVRRCRNISKEAVQRLGKALPGCIIVSDFG